MEYLRMPPRTLRRHAGRRGWRLRGVAVDPSLSSESGSAPCMYEHVGLSKFCGSALARVSRRAAQQAGRRTSSAAASSGAPVFHFRQAQRGAWTRLSQRPGENAALGSVPGREAPLRRAAVSTVSLPTLQEKTSSAPPIRRASLGPDSC